MEGTARRVAVFIGAGALLAALVGFTVWATSSPGQNNRAGFTAEAAGTNDTSATPTTSSPTTETVTENQTHTRTVRSSASVADNGRNANHGGGSAGRASSDKERAGASVPTGYNAAQDPYLPPHAVVAPAPESAQPPRVYRPSNIVPSPARPQAAPQDAKPAAEPTPAGAQTSARTTSQQTPGSTPPREPGESSAAQPSISATPAPGGSEVQPSEATEPTRTPAPEPSKQPEQPQTTEASDESEQTPQPGHGSGPSHGPDDMDGSGNTGGAAGIQVGEPSEQEPSHAQDAPQSPAPKTRLEGAGAAAQPSTGAEITDDADSASASQVAPEAAAAEEPAEPTRVAGKEDVAGYPKEDEGMTARGVLDKITGR